MAIAASQSMTIGPVTLAFPHLFQPQAPRNSNSDPKYNVTALLTQAQYDQLLPLMMGTVEAAFRNGESARQNFGWAILPCSHKPDVFPEAAARGMYFMNMKAGQQFKPEVVDVNRQPIIDPGVIKDGATAYVSVNFYDYNNSGNIGVSAGLGPVMFMEQGEVLNVGGGGVSAADAFANVQVAGAVAPGGAPMPGQAAAPAAAPGAPAAAPAAPGAPVAGAPAAPAAAAPAAGVPPTGLPPQ